MSLRSTLLKVLGAVALAFAVFTPAAAAPPEGNIQVNYHRADGNYAGWGLHLWKSPNMPVDGCEWPNPLKPTGTNDFGVFWTRPDEDLANRSKTKETVNYIIHNGDIKEQNGKDMQFNGLEHKEIWVYSGDFTIFYSLADVKAAHNDIK
jgi:hypothetical protein